MTITIELDLTPEQQKALHAEALRRGLSIADYAATLLEKHLPQATAGNAADPKDRAAVFREWAASHSMNNPLLAEDYTRSDRS